MALINLVNINMYFFSAELLAVIYLNSLHGKPVDLCFALAWRV